MHKTIYKISMLATVVLCFMSSVFGQQKHPCDRYIESRLRLGLELCEKNYITADKYTLYSIARAYELGFANAKFEGELLTKLGEKDTREAITWYQRAAELGDDGSAYVLGGIYRFGSNEITKNYEKAIYWYKIAVSLKNPTAASELASIYGRGLKSISHLQSDYLQYYWTLISDAIDKKSDTQWNRQIEERLTYKDIVEVQNKVELCVKSNFKNCNP